MYFTYPKKSFFTKILLNHEVFLISGLFLFISIPLTGWYLNIRYGCDMFSRFGAVMVAIAVVLVIFQIHIESYRRDIDLIQNTMKMYRDGDYRKSIYDAKNLSTKDREKYEKTIINDYPIFFSYLSNDRFNAENSKSLSIILELIFVVIGTVIWGFGDLIFLSLNPNFSPTIQIFTCF